MTAGCALSVPLVRSRPLSIRHDRTEGHRLPPPPRADRSAQGGSPVLTAYWAAKGGAGATVLAAAHA
ncbi:MAG TPA: hypothetical protein VGE43_14075, partial [Acidimicrobiales bacterium]